jgi:hypothetical protein
MPVRLRDKRAASDDGYDDYLTVAEEVARSVRVAASKEKLRILKDCKGILEEIDGNDNEHIFIRGDDGRPAVPGCGTGTDGGRVQKRKGRQGPFNRRGKG